MRRYDLISFDFDGTLADSAPWFVGVLNQLAQGHGFRSVDDAEIEVLRRLPTREIMRSLGIRFWQLPGIARELRRRSFEAAHTIALFQGIPEVLAGLASQGVTIAVVSSNGEATVRAILGPAAVHVRHFRCGSSLFGKASKIDELRRQVGASPHRTLHVGDETRDIEAARKAGVLSGAATYGYADIAPLRALTPDLIFARPSAILDHCS